MAPMDGWLVVPLMLSAHQWRGAAAKSGSGRCAGRLEQRLAGAGHIVCNHGQLGLASSLSPLPACNRPHTTGCTVLNA